MRPALERLASKPPPGDVAHSQAAASTTAASTLAGGAWTSLAYALPQVYTLVLSVVAARFLGPDGMGRQSFIAWAAITTASLTQGIAGTLQRYVAEMLGRGRPEVAVALLRWAWPAAYILSLLLGGALAAIGAARGELESAWILAGILCAALVLHSVPHSLLLGYQRFRQATIAALVTGGAGTVGTIVVLALGGGITGMFAVEACVAAVALLWLTTLARATVADAPEPAPLAGLRSPVLRYAGFSTIVGVLVLVVDRRSEFFALEAFSSPEQIAFYSIAFAAIAALIRLVEGATAPVVPAVATLYGAGELPRIRVGLTLAVRLMLLLSIPVVAATLTLGGPAIRLAYGAEFADAEQVLLILVGAFPLLALYHLASATMDGIGGVRLVMLAMAAAAVVDIGLALALVPSLDALGAAIANAAAQTTGAILLLFLVRSLVGHFELGLAALLPMAAVSAIAGLVAWLAASALPASTAAVGALPAFVVAFGAGALALRPLPRADADWILEAVGDRLGGRVGRLGARLAR